MVFRQHVVIKNLRLSSRDVFAPDRETLDTSDHILHRVLDVDQVRIRHALDAQVLFANSGNDPLLRIRLYSIAVLAK